MNNLEHKTEQTSKTISIKSYFITLLCIATACVIASIFICKTSFVEDVGLIPRIYTKVPCKLIKYDEYPGTCEDNSCIRSNQTWQVTVNNTYYSSLFYDEEPKSKNVLINVEYMCYCNIHYPAETIRFNDGGNITVRVAGFATILFAIFVTPYLLYLFVRYAICEEDKPNTIVSGQRDTLRDTEDSV